MLKRERLFQRVGKIHKSETSDEIAKMDFVDSGDGATFLLIQVTFRDIIRLLLAGLEGWEKRNKPTGKRRTQC